MCIYSQLQTCRHITNHNKIKILATSLENILKRLPDDGLM